MDLSLRKKLFFVFVIFLTGGAVLEGAARLFLTVDVPEPVVPKEIGQFDELLGWSLIPNALGISNRTGYPIEYRINSNGLRDDEMPYEKPDGVFRIVLLGDSRSFGFGVPIEKHFSTLLGGYFKNVEVINMGVSGFGVDQELLFLRSEGFRYDPDLVIAYVAHYGGSRHMYTERWGKAKPKFELVKGELILTNYPVQNLASQPPSSIRGKVGRWLLSKSKAYEIFRNGILGFIRRDQQSPSAVPIPPEEDDPEDESFQVELYALGEALVFAMYEETAQREIEFVLLTHIKELHEASLEQLIYSLDVSTPMANSKFPLPDDLQHFNEAGSGVLAWELAQFLQANQLVPDEHVPNNDPE